MYYLWSFKRPILKIVFKFKGDIHILAFGGHLILSLPMWDASPQHKQVALPQEALFIIKTKRTKCLVNMHAFDSKGWLANLLH